MQDPLLGRNTLSARSQLLLFSLTYASYVAIYFARKPVSIVKSTLESELGLSRSSLGMIDTTMLGLYCFGQMMLGTTVAKLGRTATIVSAFVMSALFTAAFGLLSDPTMMAVSWGLCGFFAATVNPLLVLFVADLYPPSKRASMVGLWQTSQQMGGVAANSVASAVLATFGWRAVFGSSGVIVGVFAPLLLLALVQHEKDTGGAGSSKSANSSKKGQATAVSPFNVPGAASTGAAYMVVKMARYCLMMWLPYFLSQYVGISPAAAGILSTVFDLAGALGTIVVGVIVDKCYDGKMITICLPQAIATGVAFLFWALLGAYEARTGSTPSVIGHVVAMSIVGILVAGPDGILGGAASRNLVDYGGFNQDPAAAAAVSGMVNSCGSIGAILQGNLTAKLLDVAGWTGLFLTLACAMFLAALSMVPAVRVETKAKKKRLPD